MSYYIDSNVKSELASNLNLDCDFENDLCAWQQDNLRSNYNWIFNDPLLNGITDTQNFFKNLDPGFKTGPQNGGVNGSRYIYLNSLRKVTSNQNAILTTSQIKTSVPFEFCLE
jgi:hypothetical protein